MAPDAEIHASSRSGSSVSSRNETGLSRTTRAPPPGRNRAARANRPSKTRSPGSLGGSPEGGGRSAPASGDAPLPDSDSARANTGDEGDAQAEATIEAANKAAKRTARSPCLWKGKLSSGSSRNPPAAGRSRVGPCSSSDGPAMAKVRVFRALAPVRSVRARSLGSASLRSGGTSVISQRRRSRRTTSTLANG